MTKRVTDHRQLRVWQAAMELVNNVYALTRHFPPEERFGLTQQLQRAAVSVPSNIAEGFSRESTKEYLRFLSIARGSLSEVQTQLEIAARLGYQAERFVTPLIEEADSVGRQLNALRRALQNRSRASSAGNGDAIEAEEEE